MLFAINVFATKDNYTDIIPALEQMNFNVSDACFTSVSGEPVLAAMCTSDLTNIQIVAALDSCAQDNNMVIHSLLTSEGFDDVSSGYKAFTTNQDKPVDKKSFMTPSRSKKEARHIMETKIPVHLSKYTQEFKNLMMNHTEYFLAVSEIPQYIWDDVILPVVESEEETIFLCFEQYNGSTMCSLRLRMNRKATGEIMNLLAEYGFDLADITEEMMYRVQLNQDYQFPKSKFLKAIRALASEGLFIEQFETDVFIFKSSELSNLVCKEPFEQFMDTSICKEPNHDNCLTIDRLGAVLQYDDADDLATDRAMLQFLLKGKLN